MTKETDSIQYLQRTLELPCGAVLKNRLAKSPMSDSLADGQGNPTDAQIRLYQRWAEGGVALSLIGEVQVDPRFPEGPGNLVFGKTSNLDALKLLSSRGTTAGAHLWPQIGHAGALSYSQIGQPKGPSPLDLEELQCAGMSVEDVRELPKRYANAALIAKATGFTGVQIHAGHGFLLSQFLSPLFNHRKDEYGGSIEARSRIVLEIISEVRRAVGAHFPVGIRINSSDQLQGGLTELEALQLVSLLDNTSIDLIDISGGTYFPGAKASSEGASRGPYFIDFARRAKALSRVPIMLTGGFKTREQALDALSSGAADIVSVARGMVLEPRLAQEWLKPAGGDPLFPRFESSVPGGITAWYTLRLTALAEDREAEFDLDLASAIREYEARDAQRCKPWRKTFLDSGRQC